MELNIIKTLKTKVTTAVDKRLLKQGRVLEVRWWPNSPVVEIDLYLPGSRMQTWVEVPYIKFRVADLQFRDYTPFGWDAETETCSLLVDAAHKGLGTSWARALQAGNIVQYVKIDTTHQSPHQTHLVVGLGDCSSIAHLLALRQLTLPHSRFDGALLTNDAETRHLLSNYFYGSIKATGSYNELAAWLSRQNYCSTHTAFYFTGNQSFVITLRKLLKELGYNNLRTKAFWS